MGVVIRVCPVATLVLGLALGPPAARAEDTVAPTSLGNCRAGYQGGCRGAFRAGEVERWQPYIDEASLRFGIPATWIARVIRAESAGRTMRGGQPIRSRAGAMGLMQLMPATWAEMRARLGLGNDPDEPRANILAGTLYLRLMYDRFGYPGLFGAYNAGPARYAAYLDGQQRLPGETTAYLAQVAGGGIGQVTGGVASSVAGDISGGPGRPAVPSPPALFMVRRENDARAMAAAVAVRAGAQVPETALFAIRKIAP